MSTKPQRLKGRDAALSALNGAIEDLNLAEEISSITPAKAAFGLVSVLLSMIRDSMINKMNYVELGLTCADVCKALNRGIRGQKKEQLNRSVFEAIEQLATTLSEIKSYVTFLIEWPQDFVPPDDQERIAAWRSTMSALLHLFNAKLAIGTHVVADKDLPSNQEHLPFPNPNAQIEFYKKFKREADEYDNDFVKKYNDEADTTLIFAGLFSAVASAFIIDVQSQLQPDYTQMSYALLKIIASTSLGNIPTGPDAIFPQWTGPDPAIVHVQAILYSSLAASLLSAFIAMLGKQWLNRFAQVEISGSIAKRSRNRVRKLDGMVIWHFDLVMECLPLMLQAALLLLGYALSNYLFFINKSVAGVLIGFTTFGLLFYSLIVSAATFSYTCPFQTPLSRILRFMIHLDDKHKKYLRRSTRRLRRIFSPRGLGRVDRNVIDDPLEFAMIGPPHQPPSLFSQAVRDCYVLDSASIIRLFGISTEADVTLAITKFIPEIVWHADIRTIPLKWLYDTLLDCFESSSGRLVVIPKLRNEAYFAAKALLHLTIQRKCIGDGSDRALFGSVSTQHRIMGSENYEGDSDLQSTLTIIDHVLFDLRGHRPISWPNFSPTTTHLAWMSHILLYRAWDFRRDNLPLPDDVRQFVLHALRLDPPPRAPIVTDCLLIIGLVLGIVDFRTCDLLVTDKSGFIQDEPELPRHRHKFPQIDRIYEKLFATFTTPTTTTIEIDRALEAMELIAPLCMVGIAAKNYRLFLIVMRTPVSAAYSQEKKWQAARHAIRGAYKGKKVLPWIGDSQEIPIFLDHHFDLAIQHGENQDEPIDNALRALVHAATPATIEALKQFDPTRPSFVRGVRYLFQDNQPFDRREDAFWFLPLIVDSWFNTPYPIMEPDEMQSFCVDWASTFDSMEHNYSLKRGALFILFSMMNSPHWRPHIVSDKWKILEYFTSIPEDTKPLRRCLDNLELIDAVSEVDNPTAIVLWLRVLWLRYKELIPEVREQLERRTKEVAQGERKADLDMYLSAVDSEVAKVKDALMQHHVESTDPAAISLRTKIDNLQQAKVSLIALKEGS